MKTVSASQHHNRPVLPGAVRLSVVGTVAPPVINITISVVLVSPLHHHSVQRGARKLSVVETVTQPAPNTMIYVESVYHLLRQHLSQHVLPSVPKLSNKVSVIQAVMLSPAYVVRVYRKQLHHHHHNA